MVLWVSEVWVGCIWSRAAGAEVIAVCARTESKLRKFRENLVLSMAIQIMMKC